MPDQIAGTEIYSWALAKSMQRNGHLVTIVVPNYNSVNFNTYDYDELKVVKYAEPSLVDRLLVMGKRAPDGIVFFEDLVKRLKPDIVHVQELAGSSGIGLYHLRLLKTLNIRIILTMHLARYSCFRDTLMYKGKVPCDGTIDIKRCTKCALGKLPINNFRQDLLFKLSMPLYHCKVNTGGINSPIGTGLSYPFIIEKFKKSLLEIAELCDKLVVLTDWYKEILLKNGVPVKKIHLIKQALPYVTENVKIVKQWGKLPIKLIFIGRIHPSKGLHLLLESLEDFPVDQVTLDVYGSINDTEYFYYWKKRAEGKINIAFKGLLEQKDVVSTISKYDALILPSVFSEMSPLVIQEAWAACVPVIGSNVPGIAEQVENGKNGLLFEYNSIKSLKNVLRFIIKTPTIIGELTKGIIVPPSFDTVVNQMTALYEKLLISNVEKTSI